jgi:hypothetical protein
VVAVLGLAGVEFVLHSLFAASCSLLVLKILSSIKIWYAFGVLSKKQFGWLCGSKLKIV